MAQLITCPECKKQLQVPDELLGKTVQCPECGHMFAAAPAAEKPAEPWSKPEERKADGGSKPKGKSRYDEDEDRDDDDRPSRRESRDIRDRDKRPGKVQGIAVMALIGGIYAILWFLGVAGSSAGFCCLWPGLYYSLIVGILAIIKGAALLGADARNHAPPTGIAIMLIVNAINLDVVSVVLGIIMLIFCGDEEVQEYLAKK